MSNNRMLVNYVPGDECRVAVVCDGKLEEYFAERTSVASHVGNIYVGKVVNVEASIQAAFVDFGLEQNGFLHISDLHPRYFPGDADSTERVGRKTPRRERPPIQQALRRGQEIVVQVIKEGIGAKGPTLTSYISIPGRYLVMMPDMDRVGVSRRTEDDDQRRQMRDALNQLELPEGFGFILRTAGLSRTKAELKRDLSYLMRLWKDMERREAASDKPRLLYAESDLLVRTLRDVLSSDISEVVVDNESAIRRAARFVKIVAPRSGVSLRHYDGTCPLFTAFGVEEQLRAALKREAPLPSGGSIVIDETEALVAIDVNSGRMRKHGDAETTAYKTNIEAVAEICRQLRLRDLGGVIILDLIDMRSRPHRRDIEKRLKDELKRDRARWQMLPISDFGIVELTRQRMRGSLRSAHYAPCPTCEGRGLLQRPESVASDAVRDLASLLHHDAVRRVEFVVSPAVAGILLSGKRQTLNRLELRSGKRIDVRVSETIDVDRAIFYAYDERGADVDIERLPAPAPPAKLPEWTEKPKPGADWARDPLEEAAESTLAPEPEPEPEAEYAEDAALVEVFEDGDEEAEEASGSGALSAIASEDEAALAQTKKRRRRRRRGRRGRSKDADAGEPQDAQDAQADSKQADSEQTGAAKTGEAPAKPDEKGGDGHPRKKRRRRGRRGGGGGGGAQRAKSDSASAEGDAQPNADAAPTAGSQHSGNGRAAASKKKRRRGRRKPASADAKSESGSAGAPASKVEAPAAGEADARPGASDGAPSTSKKRRRRRSSKQAAPSGADVDSDGSQGAAKRSGARSKRKSSSRQRAGAGSSGSSKSTGAGDAKGGSAGGASAG